MEFWTAHNLYEQLAVLPSSDGGTHSVVPIRKNYHLVNGPDLLQNAAYYSFNISNLQLLTN